MQKNKPSFWLNKKEAYNIIQTFPEVLRFCPEVGCLSEPYRDEPVVLQYGFLCGIIIKKHTRRRWRERGRARGRHRRRSGHTEFENKFEKGMWNTANLDAQLADEHATVGGVVLGIAHDLVLAVVRIIAVCDEVSLAEARGVFVNDLLCEAKEDGDDDRGLEGFAEDDEENGD
jgi:hypothetical protein